MSKIKAAEDLKKRAKDLEELSSLSFRNLTLILETFWEGYVETTPKKIKIIDAFSLFCFLLTGIQILYCIIVGNFPMNSFLSGVFTSLGSLIITGGINNKKKKNWDFDIFLSLFKIPN